MPSAKTARRDVPVPGQPGIFRDAHTGTYMARWGKNGKRRGLRTLADAKRWRAKMQLAPRRPTRGLPTFRDYAERWAETYQGRARGGIRPETLADYQDNLRRYALPLLGDLRLDRIDPAMLRRLLADLDERGLARNSIRLALSPVRLVFAQACEDGLLDRDPTLGVRIRGRRTRRPREQRALSRGQLEALIAAVDDVGDRLLVRFMAETGLRVSEVAALRWCDLAGGVVHVHRRHRQQGMGETKTPASMRSVPISPETARELLRLRNRDEWTGDDDLVWPSSTGTPRDYANLYTRLLVPARSRAGLPWVGWHTLRRTCATLLVVEHRKLPGEVQAWLGHEDPAITMALYTQLASRDLEPVAWARPGDAHGDAHEAEDAHGTPTELPSLVTHLRENG